MVTACCEQGKVWERAAKDRKDDGVAPSGSSTYLSLFNPLVKADP